MDSCRILKKFHLRTPLHILSYSQNSMDMFLELIDRALMRSVKSILLIKYVENTNVFKCLLFYFMLSYIDFRKVLT